MATKTKKSTKDKVKSSLKNVLLKEMKDKKEDERLLRVEENKNINEVTVYTKFSTPLCTQLLEQLESEGIAFVEKPLLDNEDEFNEVALLTGQYQFPTVLVYGEYLVANRDFAQTPQVIEIIKKIGREGVVLPSVDIRTLEGIKNLGGGVQQQFMHLGRQLQGIQQKLDPITKFIDKLKEEIESEDE